MNASKFQDLRMLNFRRCYQYAQASMQLMDGKRSYHHDFPLSYLRQLWQMADRMARNNIRFVG